jgi:hypothetical protein
MNSCDGQTFGALRLAPNAPYVTLSAHYLRAPNRTSIDDNSSGLM